MPHKLIAHKAQTIFVADSLAAGSAVGYGARTVFLGDVDLIVSIIAGLLVACSAGLSIYLNLKERARIKRAEEQEQQDTE